MSKDTGQRIFRRNSKCNAEKKKGRVCTRPAGTFSQPRVSRQVVETKIVATATLATNYFGVVLWGFGAVVAGLAEGAAGLVAAGFGVGAGTPDCAL